MPRPDVHALADDVAARLAAIARPERAEQEKRYLKTELDVLGAPVPAIRRVAKDVAREHPDLDHAGLVALASALWDRPVLESRVVTVELLDAYASRLGVVDLDLIEGFLRTARTWALVDALAANVVGAVVERHPQETGAVLDRWSGDADFWLRRSALLALLVPLRRGAGDFDRFARYADAMLEEKEFFVRKAIGWVLRDTGRRRPDLVATWLEPRIARASGVTVREAVKPLPDDVRARLLARRDATRIAHRGHG